LTVVRSRACVIASRERLQNARNNISACKSLLQCKRDELKQLWRENAEQRRVVEIIDRVYVEASAPLARTNDCAVRRSAQRQARFAMHSPKDCT
jgi:hypothetical protein